MVRRFGDLSSEDPCDSVEIRVGMRRLAKRRALERELMPSGVSVSRGQGEEHEKKGESQCAFI